VTPEAAVSDARSAHDINPVSVDALLAWGLAEAGRGGRRRRRPDLHKGDLEPTGQLAAVVLRAKLLERLAGPNAALFDAQQAAGARSARRAGAYAASLATAP